MGARRLPNEKNQPLTVMNEPPTNYEFKQKVQFEFRPRGLSFSCPRIAEYNAPSSSARKGQVRHGAADEVQDFVGRSLKPTYPEHVQNWLAAEGDPSGNKPRSLAVIGFRNVGQNIGYGAYLGDPEFSLLLRDDEPESWVHHGLVRFRDGLTALHRLRFHPRREGAGRIELLDDAGQEGNVAFAVTGPPVLWEGEVVPQDLQAGYNYDLRHVFHILWERWQVARFPDTAIRHRLAHDELMACFMTLLGSPAEDRARAMLVIANKHGLRTEAGYLMSAIGIRPDGTFISVKQHSSIQDLGSALLSAGCSHGIMNHQGGSVGAALWLKREWEAKGWKPQGGGVAPYFVGTGTYFRPHALAVLVAEFDEDPIEPPFRP